MSKLKWYSLPYLDGEVKGVLNIAAKNKTDAFNILRENRPKASVKSINKLCNFKIKKEDK